VNTFVIDASVAVKWVVDEDGTPEAPPKSQVDRA
jgi:predicted nucleic acid-binding protein